MSKTTTLAVALSCLLLAGPAMAQGNQQPPTKEQISEGTVAGPGFVQDDFFKNLLECLKESFGKDRGSELMTAFSVAKLEIREVMDLMNGKNLTKKKIKEWFRAKESEVEGIKECIKKAIEQKDKGLFFGVMLFTMMKDFDVDPTGEFAKQACGAKDEMGDKSWQKLKSGSQSKNTMKEAFGFSNKDDQKFMQDIMKRMKESGMLNHPMCASMGMGDASKMNKRKFPEMGKGSAGFGQFGDGTAGGKPFDKKMPPCPFFGDNMDSLLGRGDLGGGETDAGK